MTIASDKCKSSPAVECTIIPSARHLPSALTILPGVGLAGAIAVAALPIRHFHALTAFSPMMLAMAIADGALSARRIDGDALVVVVGPRHPYAKHRKLPTDWLIHTNPQIDRPM